MNKKLRKIAEKIVEYENMLQLDNNDKFAINKIEEIMVSLSIEEMLEIDDYIIHNKLLNKEN